MCDFPPVCNLAFEGVFRGSEIDSDGRSIWSFGVRYLLQKPRCHLFQVSQSLLNSPERRSSQVKVLNQRKFVHIITWGSTSSEPSVAGSSGRFCPGSLWEIDTCRPKEERLKLRPISSESHKPRVLPSRGTRPDRTPCPAPNTAQWTDKAAMSDSPSNLTHQPGNRLTASAASHSP